MKVVIVLVLLGIVGVLAGAGMLMLRRRGNGDEAPGAAPDKRMARALALRVGLSVLLFLFILLSYTLGWIQPTGIALTR